jgi:hypothetical protein
MESPALVKTAAADKPILPGSIYGNTVAGILPHWVPIPKMSTAMDWDTNWTIGHVNFDNLPEATRARQHDSWGSEPEVLVGKSSK